MPRARKKLDRIRQIHAWAQSRFPTPHPTSLRFVREAQCPDASGYVELHRRKLRITLLQTAPLYHMQEILFHELAHAISWGHHKMPTPDHSPEWGIALASVYRAFYDENGWRESHECRWR